MYQKIEKATGFPPNASVLDTTVVKFLHHMAHTCNTTLYQQPTNTANPIFIRINEKYI
jgi:hypothetical protein